MSTETLSNDEKDIAIKKILDAGIVTPLDSVKKNLLALRFCAPKHIFFDMGDCLFLGLLAAAAGWIALLNINGGFVCCSLLFASPFAYMITCLLTAWKERQRRMYEIKMTCYFNLHQVTALRMLYFSGLNLIVNFVMILLERRISIFGALFWRLLGISFSGIFIYGVLLIAFQIKVHGRMSVILPPVFWLTINSVIFIVWNERIEFIILNLSVYIVYLVTAGLLMLYIAMLYIYMTNWKGETDYAFSE